jgi:hypothetical protein
MKIKSSRKRVESESLGLRAHNLLDSWIRQLESDVRNYELQCYRAYKHTWSPMSETKEH